MIPDPAVPDDVVLRPHSALVVYGTLMPGQSNFEVMADVPGRWFEVGIRGTKFWVEPDGDQDQIWGRHVRYPGFRADPAGSLIPAAVLVSDDFDSYWHRLDSFEGPGYRRVAVPVWDRVAERELGQAFVYEARRNFWREDHETETL